MKLVKIFEQVPDFRNKKLISHILSEILVISLCAVLSGADDFEEISEYGLERASFLGQFLKLPKGIPSPDTFRRTFQNIETQSFEKCLRDQSENILAGLEDYQINIDGKVLRATGKRGKKTAAICIVSAWASDYCLSLGQSKVDNKSNEKTAIPTIIKTVNVKGNLVTIDAMGCDKKIASLIRFYEGDYHLALKKNQKGLYEEVHDWMKKYKLNMDTHIEVDYVGGRIEKRTTYVCKDLTFIDESKNWQDSKRVIMIESQRSFKSGLEKTTNQTRFYISSKEQDAEYFNKVTRNHWGIENQLHWFLDVVFNEDRQRVREGNAPENMAIMRKLALQTLLKHKGKKSMKTFRKKIAWNENLLIQVLQDF